MLTAERITYYYHIDQHATITSICILHICLANIAVHLYEMSYPMCLFLVRDWTRDDFCVGAAMHIGTNIRLPETH